MSCLCDTKNVQLAVEDALVVFFTGLKISEMAGSGWLLFGTERTIWAQSGTEANTALKQTNNFQSQSEFEF